MLKGKTVILGVSGSIAAYKAANLASMLVKLQCDVHVIMTENAAHFIHPITFETLTKNKCLTDTFDRNFEFHVGHVALAKRADLILAAPASANLIARMAAGIGDDMLTTTVLACKKKKIVVPAMNTNMYENPLVQENISRLRQFGIDVLEPGSGRLACGDVGKGKLPPEDEIIEYVLKEIRLPQDMEGKRVLVTAGPTREPLDPVRFLTNHSSGKMGYALARAAMQRGAKVTLITGAVSEKVPRFVDCIPVQTAADMFAAVKERAKDQDILIKAAAVADYTPARVRAEKMKKGEQELQLPLLRTEDILKWLGENKKAGQFICGFSMETEQLLENSAKKLRSKHADMIVANSLRTEGAGFGTDTNIVTLITEEGAKELPKMSKDQAAVKILDAILERFRPPANSPD